MKKILITTIIAVGGVGVNPTPTVAQTIIYVKPDGNGDGSSWANACDLEHAVGNKSAVGVGFKPTPTPNTQIWVQTGTYYPSAMLIVPNSVKMFGGFSGTETDVSQRDFVGNPTIIDAQKKFGSVVRLGVSAELNGFVIQNGNAQDNPHVHGGGVFADDHSVIANCLIINNTASTHGGGIYSKGPITIVGTTIKDNISTGNGANIFGNCLTVLGHGEGSLVQSEVPIVTTGCVDSTFNLGTVSFVSVTTRTITGTVDGKPITQIWSDAVTATGCQKMAYNGGSSGAYNVDCRSNPGYPGDLFSWCAVVKYASTLCPAPWRVPSVQDFINLDKALGGTGENKGGVPSALSKYIGTGSNQWGAVYGGTVTSSLSGQGSYAKYWSQTEYSVGYGYVCDLTSGNGVFPQYGGGKHAGGTLRCVR